MSKIFNYNTLTQKVFFTLKFLNPRSLYKKVKQMLKSRQTLCVCLTLSYSQGSCSSGLLPKIVLRETTFVN